MELLGDGVGISFSLENCQFSKYFYQLHTLIQVNAELFPYLIYMLGLFHFRGSG